MGNCIVVVQFDLPKRTQDQAISGGTGSAPIYRGLAGQGLIRKDYLNGEAGTGGVYLWESRADAEKVYTPEWRRMIADRYGAEPEITYFESPVIVDNETRDEGPRRGAGMLSV